MPQSSNRVSSFDLASDLNSYYKGCVVTYLKPQKDGSVKPIPAFVEKFVGESEIRAHIRTLTEVEGSEWTSLAAVPHESLDFILPPLGSVRLPDEHWVHLCKSPARRMRKGYHHETVHVTYMENDHECNFGDGPTNKEIIRQVWYGNPDRIATNVAVWGKGIYYAADLVCTLDSEGAVSLIPGKEKLGEFVCKLLANNWDVATSKYSVRTLPSSVMMP